MRIRTTAPISWANELFQSPETNQRRRHSDRLRTRFSSFALPLLLRRCGRVRLPPLAICRCPIVAAGWQACGFAATCERRESAGIKSGSQAVRADAALFRHCPSEHPYIQMIAHRLCDHPSRGRVVRESPEAPIYHGVEREPRTRMPATPQRLWGVGARPQWMVKLGLAVAHSRQSRGSRGSFSRKPRALGGYVV